MCLEYLRLSSICLRTSSSSGRIVKITTKRRSSLQSLPLSNPIELNKHERLYKYLRVRKGVIQTLHKLSIKQKDILGFQRNQMHPLHLLKKTGWASKSKSTTQGSNKINFSKACSDLTMAKAAKEVDKPPSNRKSLPLPDHGILNLRMSISIQIGK